MALTKHRITVSLSQILVHVAMVVIMEQVGTYNPLTEPKKVTMDLEKIDTWIAQGAKPTETVARLIDAQRQNG